MVPRPSRRALLASLGVTALAGCLGGGADPEPPARIESEWPTPHADAGRSNYAPAATGPTEPVAELWRVSAVADLSTPVVADGTLYVADVGGTVLALDARTGAERWRRTVGAGAGAPRFVDGDLYVPTADAVVALDAADGAERWRRAVPGRGDVLATGRGVVRVADGIVTALARSDGSERWRTTLRDPWEPHLFAAGGAVFVSTGTHSPAPWTLAADTGTVVGDEPRSGHDFAAERFARDGTRYGLDPFFETVEARAVDDRGRSWSRGLPSKETAAVAGGGDRVFHAGSGGDGPGLHALSAADGTVEWTSADGSTEAADAGPAFVGRPVVAEECVLVRSTGGLHCFDPADGTERWTRRDDVGEQFVVADDLLFASRDGAVRAFRPP